jgi:spermidine/putrescine transport system ATP-binding protein
MTGTVDSLLFNGASSRILVRTGGGNLVEVGHAGTSAIKSGDRTEISWARKHALCFTMAG